MIYLYYDQNNYVRGYGSVPENVNNYIENPNSFFLEHFYCFHLIENELVFDEDRFNFYEERYLKENEIITIKNWLKGYDEKLAEHQRNERLGLLDSFNMEELDAEAKEKLARLQELQNE